MPIEMNDSAPTEPARAKRHKPKRGLGNVITRQRRLQQEALEKDIQDRRNKAREAARNEMYRIEQRQKSDAKMSSYRWELNLLRTVINNQAAIMRAKGRKHPVHTNVLHNGEQVVAFTDFRSITINWPGLLMPNRLDGPAVLDTVAQMKGVMQHEMGHIDFTTPWVEITAVSPLPAKHRQTATLLFKCWNMLEDQRMECLVVERVPRIANYFGTMVANVILGGDRVAVPLEQTFLMLGGRTYLPASVLKVSYEAFDQFCFNNGIANGAQQWDTLVGNYKAASTHKDIMDAVCAAYDFIQTVRASMPETSDNHDQMYTRSNDVNPDDTARKQGSILDLFDEKPKPPSKGKQDDQDDQEPQGQPQEGTSQPVDGDDEGDDEGEGSPDAGGSGDEQSDEGGDDESEGGAGNDDQGDEGADQSGDPSKGQSNGGSDTMQQTTESLSDALRSMQEKYENAIRQDKDVQQMARDANVKSDVDGLGEYSQDEPTMSQELQDRAEFTSQGIQQALNTFVTTSAPIWQNRKENGIIDPLAYRTKNTGDRDFRRHLDDHGNTGLDVHVSMLCDVSGSMGGHPMEALSESLYATALACDALGIGATFTLWSSGSQNYRVWQDGKATPTLWPAMGGTDPTDALDDLDTHNPEGAARHLVIIFTDGEWTHSFPSLQRWANDNRTFVLVRYGNYNIQKDMGADSHIDITSVNDLPGELTKALIDVLNDGSGW
jgi:hypothetical protein